MPYYRCSACSLTSYSAAAYSTASVCPNCSASLSADGKLSHMTRMGADVTRVLSARPESISEARHTVVGLPLPQADRDILALLVSELMTNCIRHAGLADDDLVKLHISSGGGRIRLAVQDHGGGFRPPTSFDHHPTLAGGGRGLMIVAELADDWGVDLDTGGCTVWCELEVEDRVATAATEQGMSAGFVRGLARQVGQRAPFPSHAH